YRRDQFGRHNRHHAHNHYCLQERNPRAVTLRSLRRVPAHSFENRNRRQQRKQRKKSSFPFVPLLPPVKFAVSRATADWGFFREWPLAIRRPATHPQRVPTRNWRIGGKERKKARFMTTSRKFGWATLLIA